jgi:hypothetical protein
LHLGILSEAEAHVLRDYDARVSELIDVDDFAPHELRAAAPSFVSAPPQL